MPILECKNQQCKELLYVGIYPKHSETWKFNCPKCGHNQQIKLPVNGRIREKSYRDMFECLKKITAEDSKTEEISEKEMSPWDIQSSFALY